MIRPLQVVIEVPADLLNAVGPRCHDCGGQWRAEALRGSNYVLVHEHSSEPEPAEART